jgi:hypothetical protein
MVSSSFAAARFSAAMSSRAGVVYMSTPPLTTRMTARTAERAYRLWLARNLTGGYWSHFEPETPRRRQGDVK